MSYEEGYCTCAGLPEKHVLGVKGCLRDVFGQPVRPTSAPSREWLLARLVGLGNDLTDEALTGLLALAEAYAAPLSRRRKLDSCTLALEQAAREAGTVLPRTADPDASPLGRALACIAREVERATKLHGRAFPGGWGPSGRREDVEAMLRAKDACDAANEAGGATFRDVAEEEIAEVFAEVPGTPGHQREIAQVAAVYVRALMACGAAKEVSDGENLG